MLNAKYNFVWFFNCPGSLGCLLEIRFPSQMCVCVPWLFSSDVVCFSFGVLLTFFCKYTRYMWANFVHSGFVIRIQLFNDAIISLLLSRFTPPFVGFVKIRTIANRWIRKKKTCVSEITVESGFSLVVLNAIQDLQWCSCNRVVVRCSFLLSVLLAPSWGWYLKVCELWFFKVFFCSWSFYSNLV